MKALHTFAFYAVVTPIISLGSGAVLAQQSTDQDYDREQKSTQHEKDAAHSMPRTMDKDLNTPRASQTGSQTAADHRSAQGQAHMRDQGSLTSVPANGVEASDLIGATVKTNDGESVGPVDDLIIDRNGQVVAILIGVGGFLGMGEKTVAVAWDQVTRTGDAGEPEFRIDTTREKLLAAPEFASIND